MLEYFHHHNLMLFMKLNIEEIKEIQLEGALRAERFLDYLKQSVFFDYFDPAENKRIPFHKLSDDQKEDIRFSIYSMALQELSASNSFSLKINNLDGKCPEIDQIFSSKLNFIKHSVNFESAEYKNDMTEDEKEYNEDTVLSLMFKKPESAFFRFENRIEFFNKLSDKLKEEIKIFKSCLDFSVSETIELENENNSELTFDSTVPEDAELKAIMNFFETSLMANVNTFEELYVGMSNTSSKQRPFSK